MEIDLGSVPLLKIRRCFRSHENVKASGDRAPLVETLSPESGNIKLVQDAADRKQPSSVVPSSPELGSRAYLTNVQFRRSATIGTGNWPS